MPRMTIVGLVSLGFLAAACSKASTRVAAPSGPGAYGTAALPNGAPPGSYPYGAPPGYGAPPAPGYAPPAPYPSPYPTPNAYPTGNPPPPAPTATNPAPPFGFPFPQLPGFPPFQLPPIPGFPVPSAPNGTPPPQAGGGTVVPGYGDPLNALDVAFLRQRATDVLAEVRNALPQNVRSMVSAIPLVVDDTPGEVNAFAACTKNGPLMAITDGLLEISAQMARAKANDELFGTTKLSEYITLVSQHQQAKQPIVRPAPGFFEPTQDNDGRKVARQHDLLDEQLAFILGHELAHHYLQHTGCVGSSSNSVTPADLGRVLSNVLPVFNQPNELAADSQGVTSLLQAGRARSGQHWNEEGAMLTLKFFVALMQMDPADRLLFAFQGTHPPPEVRIPVVQQSANQWRATGGASPTGGTPGSWPFPFPLPGFPGG